MGTPTSVGLTADWLDDVSVTKTQHSYGMKMVNNAAYAGAVNNQAIGWYEEWPRYQWYRRYYEPIFIQSDVRPIKLKMSEVEKLRAAARENPALKQILSKFTALIEVTVDFD